MSQVFSNWRIFPLKEKVGSLLANGKVTVSGTMDVSFTVIDGPKGVFASFPSQKSGKKDDKTGKDIYYPYFKLLDEATQTAFQEEVLTEWNAKNSGETSGDEAPKTSKKKVPF